jgi:hypothetical protein
MAVIGRSFEADADYASASIVPYGSEFSIPYRNIFNKSSLESEASVLANASVLA